MTGALVVVSGPSGVGKTTVVAGLLEVPGVARSISATTRAPRGSEADGKDYFFLSPEKFEEGVRKGGFLEHAVVGGNRYGTPRKAVDEAVAAGKVVVLAIDVQGAEALRRMGRPFFGVFLAPPSIEELRRRMAGRRDTPAAEAERRMALAVEEMKEKGKYDLVVINDTVKGAVDAITKALRERHLL